MLQTRSYCFILFFILLCLSGMANGQQWSGVLSSSRATDWTQAGIPGGIPSGSWTQCGSTIQPYGSAGGPASPSTIINAVNSCAGSNQYVLLGAGDFYLNAGIRIKGVSGVELRGAGAGSTHLHFYGTSTCAAGASNCEVSFEDNNGEYPTGVGTAAQWTAGYSKGATSITINNASILGIKPNQTMLVLDQNDTGFSGNTKAAGGGGVGGSAVDNGGYFACGDAYNPSGPSGCSYNGPDGSAGRPRRWQEETVLVTACSPSCTNAGPTTLTITPGLIHPNWSSSQSPEAWPIQANSNVGMQGFSVDASNTTNGQFGVDFNNVFNFWAKGLSVANTYSAGITMWNVLFGDIESNYVYNPGQSSVGNDPNNRDPSGILLNGSNTLIQNNIVQWTRIGIITGGPSAGNVIAYNFLTNCFESNGDVWGCIWDGHSNGDDFNLWEGNVAPQAFQDQTHGGKLSETYFRNLLTGWESCSNGNCSPSATAKTANLDAISVLSYNRYDNIVGNVLGTPGVSTLGYVFTNGSEFWSGPGTGHIFNLASGNGCSPSGGCQGGPIPIDNAVLTTTMWWGNWDAFNKATLACTGPGAPVAGCPQDQRGDGAPTYPGLTNPSSNLPASFYLSARPSWWSSSIPFPAIGPDVTGGNVGQCGGNPNQSGQFALVPATSSSQCAGQGLNAAWAGHVNAIPAMACYLNVMNGPPDGTGSVLKFDASACYGNSSTPKVTPPAPTNLNGVLIQ